MTSPAIGPVAIDLRAIQSPDHRGRGIGRYAYEFARALERRRPDLVGRYLLAPDWPPPGDIAPLIATGKVAYLTGGDDLPDDIRVYHSMSPFELSVPAGAVRPRLVEERGMRYSAQLYDLIPLRFSETYLADARQRRRYRARAELLRQADALLAISAAAEQDAVSLVGIAPGRVTTVGTGVTSGMAPPESRFGAFEAARASVAGLADPFVLYPGGSDGRKNVETLIRAFGALPTSVREDYQLVISCDLSPLQANHLRHVALAEGIAHRVLLPGYVADEVMRLLYQSTSLLCFPSLAEGFGLPIAEALACGAVAVVSDRTPMREMVAPAARFDPTDTSSIAATMELALTDADFRAGIEANSPVLDTWVDVAERAGKVLESLAAGRRHPWRLPSRVAIISPFPPIASGVASYSARLVEALSAELGDVVLDCFADGRSRDPRRPEMPGERPWWDARGFRAVEGAIGGYDDVIYVLGNSEYHAWALAALRRRPGLVMAHDVRMTNLLRFAGHIREAVPGGIGAAVERSYGAGTRASLTRPDDVAEEDCERYGLLLLREVLASTDRLLVSSQAARQLAEIDAGPALSDRIGVLPFASCMAASELAQVEAERRRRVREHAGAVRQLAVGSFGIVDPTKEPFHLVDAVADLVRDDGVQATLVFVGPVSDALRTAIAARASDRGIGVTLTGWVPRAEYLAWLGRVDLAVQLRNSFAGEASAAVGDCLAAGLPTVVSAIGWLGELPDNTVAKLSPEGGSALLAALLSELASDSERRQHLGGAAATFAAGQTFERVAAALAAGLRLRTGAGSRSVRRTA